MENKNTAKLTNDIIYIGVSILTIIVGFCLHRIPQIILSGMVIYYIITILFVDHITKDNNISIETHGKITSTLFLLTAILIGIATKDGKVFLLFLSLPEVTLLFYIKSKLFVFLRREMLGLFVFVWALQVISNSQTLRDMELILAILIHLAIQGIMQCYVQTVEFQLRKNREQELSLDDLLKVIMVKKDEANQAVKTKSEFLSNMSHEIRTPINAILGMNEMILKESSEKEILEYSDNIQNAGKMLLSIINDILDYSKVESGKMDIVPVEYQVSSLINDVINLFREKIKEKKLEFQLDVNRNIPNSLYGDEVRIRQIVANIMSNAIKYTDAGTISLNVDFRQTKEEKIVLCFEVRDTGRGIKQEDLSKLFETFRRVDEENNRNIEGTGLGLAITKRFVDMMDGTIIVDSKYGEGSAFCVSLPQKVRKNLPMGDFKEQYQESNQCGHHYRERFIAPKAKILVVDDNSMNLAVVQGLLKETKVQIFLAESGRACLEYLRKEHFDVILLDHMMPGMDGVETLKKIRDENLAPGIPVIALTANAISGAREMYFDYGFSDYLAKPVSGDKIEKAMMHWIPDELIERVKEEEKKKVKKVTQKMQLERPKSLEREVNLITEENTRTLPPLLDEKTALMYSISGMDGVICNIKLYLENVASTREHLLEAYQNNEYKEYGIYAHALKSTSTTIGALKLAELAKSMEFAGGNGDGNYIKVHHEQMIQMFDEIIEKSTILVEQCNEKDAFEIGEANEETTIGKVESASVEAVDYKKSTQEPVENISKLLKRLYQASEEFDSVVLDELIGELMELSIDHSELKRLRKEAKLANENCEYIELSDIISQMQKCIGK